MQPHHHPEQPPPSQPHYMQVGKSEAAVSAATQKGQRDIAFGIVWIVAGMLITVITYASDMPVYLVAWGPALYGVIKIVRGAITLSRR